MKHLAAWEALSLYLTAVWLGLVWLAWYIGIFAWIAARGWRKFDTEQNTLAKLQRPAHDSG